MRQFPEMNWSGFIRKEITQKVKELTWKEEMLKRLKDEEEFSEWAIKVTKEARKGRFEELRRKGRV